MNTTIKLALPLVLGLAAFISNYFFLNAKLKVRTYTVLKADVAKGEPFTPENMLEIRVEGGIDETMPTAVPFSESAVLINQIAARDMKAGELLLWRDAAPPAREFVSNDESERELSVSLDNVQVVPGTIRVGDQITFTLAVTRPPSADQSAASPPASDTGSAVFVRPPRAGQTGGPTTTVSYEIIGPFRVTSVGGQLNREGAAVPSVNETVSPRLISVAVRLEPGNKLDSASAQLVSAIDGGEARRIVAVLIHPTIRKADEKTAG